MLKAGIVAIACLINFKVMAAGDFTNVITSNEKDHILHMIDEVCADTWCAGDYDYKFTSFNCNSDSRNCTLSFKIIDRDARGNEPKEVLRRCNFKNVVGIKNIVDDDKLNEEFYDQLNICITNRESKK